MLIGEYKTSVTSGNRTALPKKFREELGEKIIITRGYEGCLIIVSPTQWAEMINEAASGPFVSPAVRDTSRFLLGGAHEVELDSQGRFVIPPTLKDHAEVSQEVCFLGLNRWVELWDAQHWEERKAYLSQKSGEIAEKLAEIHL